MVIKNAECRLKPTAEQMYFCTMSIITLVVIFSAPMPKSPGGLVVRASD